MPESIPVFLNGSALQAVAGGTLAQLLATVDPELLAALDQSLASATDGRGVPVDRDVPLVPGAIFRVNRSARRTAEPGDA
jgi:hypothetical protein